MSKRLPKSDLFKDFPLIDAFDHYGIQYKLSYGVSGDQFCLSECPFCGKAWKCYGNADTGFGKCFRCDKGFGTYSLLKACLGDPDSKTYLNEVESFLKSLGFSAPKPKKAIKRPQTLSGGLSLPTNTSAATHPYLLSRGFSGALIDEFDLRFCEQGKFVTRDEAGIQEQDFSNRILIPIYDEEMNLVSFQGRDIAGTSDRKYLFPRGFASTGAFLYRAHAAIGAPTIVMCEGVFDVMGAVKAFRNHPVTQSLAVVGSFGKNLSDQQKFDQIAVLNRLKESGLQHVVILWDGEWPALLSAVKAAKLITKYKLATVSVAFLPNGTDPGDCPEDKIREAYHQAIRYTGPQSEIKLKLKGSQLYQQG